MASSTTIPKQIIKAKSDIILIEIPISKYQAKGQKVTGIPTATQKLFLHSEQKKKE